jgi:hypothetical protein
MFDTLSFLAMAPKSAGLPYARETHNNGAFDAVWPIDPKSGFGKVWRIKGPKGYPWDVMLYDEEYVYDHITELDWNDAKSYKKFVGNFTNNSGKVVDGIPRFPRYITDGLPTEPLVCPVSNFRLHYNCKWDGKSNGVGKVRNQLFGPVPIDHMGDIGVQDTYICIYNWNGVASTYQDEEVYWYVPNFGLARWTHAKLNASTGMYELDKPESIHNNIFAGGTPPVYFPCP